MMSIYDEMEAARNRRTSGYDPEQRAVAQFVCGMGTEAVNATTPLARLTVFPWGVRLTGRNRLLRAVIPVWEARFDELVSIRPAVAGKAHRGSCIRFIVAGSVTQFAICGTRRVTAALDAIEAAGGSVQREPVRVYRWDPARDYVEK